MLYLIKITKRTKIVLNGPFTNGTINVALELDLQVCACMPLAILVIPYAPFVWPLEPISGQCGPLACYPATDVLRTMVERFMGVL